MMDSINLVLVINELRDVIHNNAKNKGFYDSEVNFGEKMALVHSEVSEALEEHRMNGLTDNVAEEFADIIIRVLDLCGYYDINIAHEILTKVEKNSKRPRKHGKNY
jgi:NTP pyrophosphatase (non-canonical NTP hydrolase)